MMSEFFWGEMKSKKPPKATFARSSVLDRHRFRSVSGIVVWPHPVRPRRIAYVPIKARCNSNQRTFLDRRLSLQYCNLNPGNAS